MGLAVAADAPPSAFVVYRGDLCRCVDRCAARPITNRVQAMANRRVPGWSPGQAAEAFLQLPAKSSQREFRPCQRLRLRRP